MSAARAPLPPRQEGRARSASRSLRPSSARRSRRRAAVADLCQSKEQLYDTSLHVEDPRPGGPVTVDAERPARRCPDRPHRVQVPDEQYARLLAEPPAQVRSTVGDHPLARSTNDPARRDRRRWRRKTRRRPGRHSATRSARALREPRPFRAGAGGARRPTRATARRLEIPFHGPAGSALACILRGFAALDVRSFQRVPAGSVVRTNHAAGTTRWNHRSGVTDLRTATGSLSHELAESASATALSAADHAGVEIRLLDSVAEFEAASRLVARSGATHDPKAPAALLRALSHAGNFVAGAVQRGGPRRRIHRLFRPGRRPHLLALAHHRHRPAPAEQSLGFALKQFQRSWALEHGTTSIRWTADPLVRRNLYFNLSSSARPSSTTTRDFYGPLLDGVNGDGESDRVLLTGSSHRLGSRRPPTSLRPSQW